LALLAILAERQRRQELCISAEANSNKIMGGSNQQVQKATLPTAADYKANRMAAPSVGSEREARQNYATNLMSEGQLYGQPEADRRSEALMKLAQQAFGTSSSDRFSRAIASQRQSSAASQWNSMQSQSEREKNGFNFSPDDPENYQIAANNSESAGSAAIGAGSDVLSAAIPAALSIMGGSGGGSAGLGGSLGGGGGGAMGAVVPMALKSIGGVKTGTPWIDRALKGASIGGSEGWTGGSLAGPKGAAYGALFGSVFGGLDGAVDGPIYKAKTGGRSGFGKGFDQTMSGITQMTA